MRKIIGKLAKKTHTNRKPGKRKSISRKTNARVYRNRGGSRR